MDTNIETVEGENRQAMPREVRPPNRSLVSQGFIVVQSSGKLID